MTVNTPTIQNKLPEIRTDPFETSHLDADLKGRSVRSGAVTIIAQGGRFVITTVSTMVLARLLEPADFGIMAMVNSVLVFIYLFQDAGLSAATVQRKEINHQQVSNLFWLNVAAGTGIALVTLALSPAVSLFYDDDRLLGVTASMALPLVIAGLSAQHGALLVRQMRFATQQAIGVLSSLIGVATAIIMAWQGWGYWSLAFQTIATTSAATLMFWLVVKWRPSRPRRGAKIGNMVSFGFYLTGGSFVNQITRNFDNILIGATSTAGALGLYSKAYGLLMLPIRQINAPINRVALPALSRLQSDGKRYRNFYCRAIELLAFVGMPIVVFCFVAAEEVILVMLGEKWLEARPIFQALAPAAMLGTINVVTGWIFVPMGRSKEAFWMSAASSAFVVIGFLVGIKWGALGVACSFSITSVIKILPELAYATKGSPVRLGDIGRAVWRPLCASLLAGATLWLCNVYWLEQGLQLHAVWDLLALLVMFALAYVLFTAILPGSRAFLANISKIFRESFLKRK